MSAEAGDMPLTQDEDILRKMWQETDDFGKKKEIRSHMYKIREARLKDFYNTGEETTSSSENRQHSTMSTTKTIGGTTGLKGSDLTTHADSLADHSFLSLKSKEIRDSESPTKDSYKITENRKINDRDWTVMESNEASKDGKTHTTSRIATTSGNHDLDGGKMNYAAKSEQKASVFKDGEDKNFTKAVEAASQNVIKQEAFGGDDNSKFYTSSTNTSSSSKFTSEHRSTAGEPINRGPIRTDTGDSYQRTTTYDDNPSGKTVVRKVYTENIPNEPSYIDGNTKVTTETKTLPDGSTVTTTRYETKGGSSYSTSATSSTTSSSKKHVSSNEQTSSNLTKTHTASEDSSRHLEDTGVRVTSKDSRVYDDTTVGNDNTDIKVTRSQQVQSKSVVNKADRTGVATNETIETHYTNESDIKRMQDAVLIGRDTKNVDVTLKSPVRDSQTITKVTKTINLPRQEGQTVTTVTKTTDLPRQEGQTVTTVTKTIDSPAGEVTMVTKTTKTTYDDQPADVILRTYTTPAEESHTTTKTVTTKKISSNYDNQQIASTDFLNTERQHILDTKITNLEIDSKPKQFTEELKPIAPKSQSAYEQPKDITPKHTETIEIEIVPINEQPKYEQPDRRQPYKPGKSELDDKRSPTEGQYETTYRTDYIPKRISVDVSPTHDAFARSLRSVSPDRISKTGSIRSLRTTSTTSLRGSPEKYPNKQRRESPVNSRQKSPTKKASKTPEKYVISTEIVTKGRPESPEKKSSQSIVGRHVYDTTKQIKTAQETNTDTITRGKKIVNAKTDIDSSTLTKKKEVSHRPRSRSVSPTSIASDIEFIKHGTDIVTDLDIDEVNRSTVDDVKLIRRHTEEFDKRSSPSDISPSRRPQKITDKSATLPLADIPSKKSLPSSPSRDSLKPKSLGKESTPTERNKPKPIRRTDTYEERCKEILGIGDSKEHRKPSLPSPTRAAPQFPTKTTRPIEHKEPEKPKGIKQTPSVREFPSQIRKSPQKEPSQPYPEKPKGKHQGPSVQEFPSQIRRSPEKQPLEPYKERPKSGKQPPSVQEFPSQIKRTSIKEPLEPYPGKPKDTKHVPSVQEFPSQIRKSPQKMLLGPYPEKSKDNKQSPSVQEFPSQIRRSTEKEPLEPYPERTKPTKQTPSVQEFPPQARKPAEKEPLEPYPEKPRGTKHPSSVQEFPSQARKSPQKEPLGPYPEKAKDSKQPPSVQEFPSQIRKSPQKEPLEPYPEKPKGTKVAPSVQEFPSQIKRPVEKEPLEPYPERSKPEKQAPQVDEFPSQIRKLPQKESLEPYPEKSKHPKQAPSVREFPSQTRESPQREPHSDKPIFRKRTPSEGAESFSDDHYTDTPLERSPNKVSLDDLPTLKSERLSLDDIPSVIKPERKSPERISLRDLRKKPEKVVDNFITNEKIDTEITLKKYKDDSIHVPRGIPSTQTQSDVTITKKKSKTVSKSKKDTSRTIAGEESTTSEEEEDDQDEIDKIECEIIEDVENVIERLDKTEEKEIKAIKTQELTRSVKEQSRIDKNQSAMDKGKPKTKKPVDEEPFVEDFVTVTKAQLLQTVSKTPVEEPIQVRKAVSTLCKNDVDQVSLIEKERNVKNITVDEKIIKTNKTVKKDSPDKRTSTPKLQDKKKQSEILIKKEKIDTSTKSKVDTRRTDTKPSHREPIKKTPPEDKSIIRKDAADKKIYETEVVEKKISKPTSKVITKIHLTPVRQPQLKKTVVQDVSNVTDSTNDAKIHIRIQKLDTTAKRTLNVTPAKPNQDRKPISKRPISPYKKPEDDQPKQPNKLKVIENQLPRTITRTTVQKTIEAPAKRHVVSTIINIKPKMKPETITKTIHKTTVTRTINAPKATKITPKISRTKAKPILNGHISTEEDDSDVEIIKDTEEVTTRETLKTTRDHITPSRRSPFTKPVDSTDRRKKCITTKSILIENAVADQREIIVDLKRSKSSREGTPDRICPFPVSDDVDSGIPRYPDRITEPDDGSQRLKPKRISDIPLDETVDVTEFDRITEVKEGRARTKKTEVESTDECLLSVNEKVNKFLSTAEQVTKRPMDAKPAPKVERPQLDVEDSLKEDECLLSVSDKVQKFISTAEQLSSSTKETLTSSPKHKDEEGNTPKDKITPRESFPQHKDSSDTTSENRVTVETVKTTRTRTSVSPDKKERSPGYREPDLIRFKTPERRTSDLYTKKTTEETTKIRRESFEDDTTPKTSRRLSKDEPKQVLSPTGRLRSTETIMKAKALFENFGKEQEKPKQSNILIRPSIFEARKIKKTEESTEDRKIKDVRTKLTYDEVRRTPSPGKQTQRRVRSRDHSPDEEIPHYMTPLDRTVKERQRRDDDEQDHEIDSLNSRDTSPDRDVPHYMLPLDRSVRERSPHKEHLRELEDMMIRSTTTVHSEEIDVKTNKFGVTLRRTDSGRVISTQRRPSTSSVDRQTTELEIEEIFDLEYLEKLLEIIVGYDIRRRIRSQIRFIKRAIEENTFEMLVKRRTSPTKGSPERQSVDRDDQIVSVKRHSITDKKKQTEEVTSKQVSEYQSSYKRKTSSEITSKVKSPSPVRGRKELSPQRLRDKTKSPERKPKLSGVDTVDTKTSTTTTTTRIFHTDLKKTKPLTKTVVEEKPDWVTQRTTLRKVSETTAPVKRTTTTTTTRKVTTKKENQDVKPTDVITSSYGVGPTDDDGTPLFGLKALRTQQKSEKTKVQGTVIRSQFYSENGAEPEGEISVTKFSTDPKDLMTENVAPDKGVTSVTTTQKFGYKGTPSLKAITSKTKKTSSVEDNEFKSSVRTSKVTRRGSVKEISQKFIENAVDTLKSERQSSYPKAGLILRTSSFKDTPSNGTSGSSREGSPAIQEVREKVVTSVETTSTTSDGKKADTFLSNKSRVTGVQDVISRMKNEEINVEESEEDTEARNLLNKFIGSQVLLSGIEGHTARSPISSATSSPAGSMKRTTKITTTTTSSESSKPTTVTRTFTHPITDELLQTIWDEQTLKLLLEQSTDYEDRRIIRARLREVMAEQEACAELVEKASDEATIKDSGSTVHGTTTTRTYTEGPVTTTSQITSRITSQQQVKKPMSPFAKFRQLDKQNSLNSPPSTPKSPTGGGPLFKFTDPSLNQSANTVKQRLLQWCQIKTKEYENIQLDNFSTSWADGMAFCALIHHFLPDAFDYTILNPRNRRHNFNLAFQVADEKAGIAPLLDVDDMVAISRPDWKCVFTYVQSIYRRFKDDD